MSIDSFDLYLENKNAFITACADVKRIKSDDVSSIERILISMEKTWKTLVNEVPPLFQTDEKVWNKGNMPEDIKHFWLGLTSQEGVSQKRIKLSSGDTCYFYLVTPENKELYNELKNSGGAMVQPELGLIFTLHENQFSILHELGHIDFRIKSIYNTDNYKSMSPYMKYQHEEIHADNHAIACWDQNKGDLKETLIERIRSFLDQWDFCTTVYHFPRVLNMWEKYKELIA